MAGFFTKKIRLMDASTQTENVYGLQPLEANIDQLQSKISSLTKKLTTVVIKIDDQTDTLEAIERQQRKKINEDGYARRHHPYHRHERLLFIYLFITYPLDPPSSFPFSLPPFNCLERVCLVIQLDDVYRIHIFEAYENRPRLCQLKAITLQWCANQIMKLGFIFKASFKSVM